VPAGHDAVCVDAHAVATGVAKVDGDAAAAKVPGAQTTQERSSDLVAAAA
jgi:hypothetical protein